VGSNCRSAGAGSRDSYLSDGVELTNDVIEFIATNVTTNIRELEGCLISLLATGSLEGREPTIEVAREVLRKVAKRSAPILSIETIQRTVAKRFNIDEELLRAKTRKQEIVQARQVAMYLAKELTSSSLKTIGLHFGGRDHSTVIHACQTISDDMRHSPALASKVDELKRQFELMQ
jgi:chromosomal replication initiator protein